MRVLHKKPIGLLLIVLMICGILSCVCLIAKSHKNTENTLSSESGQTSFSGTETEFRGVWINYVEFASLISGHSEQEYRSAVDGVIANITGLSLNTVILHVRSHSDAFYPSALFPWSALIAGTQGTGVTYDPLAIFLEKAHNAGLKVHAWINPYRISSGNLTRQQLAESNPAKAWLSTEKIIETSDGGLYYNPCDADVRSLILSGIRELLSGYDIDGIHFDDYFYPTTDASVDQVQYDRYCAGTVSPLSLTQWRTAQVNNLISGVYSAVKSCGRQVVFGISPQANISKNEEQFYADVTDWAKGGYCDYLCPQVYFGFNHPDSGMAYNELCTQWSALTDSSKVSLYFGLAAYKIGTADAGTDEWTANNDNLKRQTEFARSLPGYGGIILYNYSSLFSSDALNTAEKNNLSVLF